jgi:hypothetical protein
VDHQLTRGAVQLHVQPGGVAHLGQGPRRRGFPRPEQEMKLIYTGEGLPNYISLAAKKTYEVA